MADEAASTTQNDTSTSAPAVATADDAATAALGDAGKQALDRMKAERDEARKQAKALADVEKRLKEYEDRDKTEAQKLAERAEAAEKAAHDAQVELIRLRIIAEVGLEADLHEFVTGTTEDEIRAKAEKLKARSAGEPAANQPAPRPDLSQGARSGAMALNGDPLLNSVKSVLGIR
jgi:hypothetical protein